MNAYRRHLTAEQKREVIATLLVAAPERSDRATAKIANVRDKTVAAGKDLESTAEIPQLKKRTGRDGKSRAAPVIKPIRLKVTTLAFPALPPLSHTETALDLRTAPTSVSESPAPTFHVPAASWSSTTASEPEKPLVETVKRLVKELQADELDEFKHWFREYTGCALEPAQPKRSRGRPRKDGTPGWNGLHRERGQDQVEI